MIRPALARRPAASAVAAAFAVTFAVALNAAPAGAQTPSPATQLRRKNNAAAALRKGLELRAAACQQNAKSLTLDATSSDVTLRASHCKLLDGELGRAETLATRSVALAKGSTRKAIDEPRAAAFARIARQRWDEACQQFAASLRDDVTVEASLNVAACQLAALELGPARNLLGALLPTLATQSKQTRRSQPVVHALLAEAERLQPYLTVVAPAGSTLTIDGGASSGGQPYALEPGSHTIVVKTRARARTFSVILVGADRRTLSIEQEQDRLAGAEFASGGALLTQGCQDIERTTNASSAGVMALTQLAWCRRLLGQHAAVDTLWNAVEALLSAGRTSEATSAQLEARLRASGETLRQACAHFAASLELDVDLATELAVAACQLREHRLRAARLLLERTLSPQGALAAPKDALGREQAELARGLLADVERLQPKLRVEPAPGFQGTITVNGVPIAPNTHLPLDPGRYVVLQIPTRGPRIVHEITLATRERILLKRHLRCAASGKSCVDPGSGR